MLVEDTMEHNHETKKWIRSGSKNPRSKKNNWKLLQINQIPSHLRFNKYVLSHYRPETNWIGCVKSLFYLHNETVNILTHGIPVLAILAAIPWILPWDEITVPYLPIFHVVSSITPWVGSTLYHLFMNHNTGYIAYKVLLTIDMLGIWVTQTAGGLVTICATIHCFSQETKSKLLWTYGLLCLYCLYKVLTAQCVWGRRFSYTAPFLVRVTMIVLRYLGIGGGNPLSFHYVVYQDVIAVIGGFIGGINIPERWFPGRLDLICNSHHLMHVLVVYAVYQMHLGATLDLQWMTAINQGVVQCNQQQTQWAKILDSYTIN